MIVVEEWLTTEKAHVQFLDFVFEAEADWEQQMPAVRRERVDRLAAE